jgi:hypothetical protein
MISAKKGGKMAHILLMSACLLFAAGISHNALAATCTHYVSPSGSSSWINATNISTPASVQTAFDNAIAGNVACFRGGTYTVPAKNFADTYIGYYAPANSGTSGSPITFQAYPGETPVFNGTAGGTGDGENGATVFGVYKKSHIVFDGLTIQSNNGTKQGRMIIGYNDEAEMTSNHSTNHITVSNCTFIGAPWTGTDNAEGLRLEGVSYLTVTNNTFYDYIDTGGWHNTSAIKEYHIDNAVIANNEIYNCTTGIYLKSRCNTCSVGYNYVHDVGTGIYDDAWNVGYDMPNHTIYHNVITNYTGAGIFIIAESGGRFDNLQVYNNTLHTDTSGIADLSIAENTGGFVPSNSQSVYNNIMHSGANSRLILFGASDATYSDYNYFGPDSYREIRYGENGGPYARYSSLSSWQQSTYCTTCAGNHPDMHSSSAASPLFVNGSGDYSLLSDFNLQATSPCKGTGQGGINMGADISKVGPTACANLPVRINNTGPGYATISAAYIAAETGQILNIRDTTFSETLFLSDSIIVTLKGGYDCNYLSSSGYSTISGSMTISEGTATIDKVIIRQ